MNFSTVLRFVFCYSGLLFAAISPDVFATCGGGGGGGRGGAVPSARMPSSNASGSGSSSSNYKNSSSSDDSSYHVAWRICGPKSALPTEDASLLLLWFSPSAAATSGSRLLTSRVLSLAGARCVSEAMVTMDNKSLYASYKVARDDEVVVLTAPDGSELGRVSSDTSGNLDIRSVEKLLNNEIDTREKRLDALFKGVDKKVKTDAKGAIEDLQAVWAQRCLFPNLGKRAGKALKKLGVKVEEAALTSLGADDVADADIHNVNTEAATALEIGLKAELEARYRDAEQAYARAVELDPADPTALRFLGEFYRHQTGQWDKAGRIFNRLLAQPADPIARAVALHGLGKMTIHAGRFAEGLALFQRSLDAFPLPITYRNLAVYWFSEKEADKAAGFMRQALALDPDDRYNQIFAAVYLAAAGHKEEAIKIAQQNESVLEASYNLAAIWAQVGDRAKAMELLRRQFYGYEQFDAVRSMEMKEAREDYMFASLHADADFAELTKNAKNAWMIGLEFCSPAQLDPITAPPGPRKM